MVERGWEEMWMNMALTGRGEKEIEVKARDLRFFLVGCNSGRLEGQPNSNSTFTFRVRVSVGFYSSLFGLRFIWVRIYLDWVWVAQLFKI